MINCPEESTNQPVVTVTFRHGIASRPVARARVRSAANVHWPETSGAWACLAVQFTVLGGRQPALAGNVIGPLQRLLNVNLAKPPS